MDRLGTQSKRITVRSESYIIAICFVAVAILEEGAIVQLDADGTVSRFTGAAGKIPLGSLEVGNRKENEEVTVRTQFQAETVGIAGAAITGAGVQLTVNADGEYVPATAGDYVIGLSLAAAASDDDVRVGIYRVFTQIAEA